MNAGFAVKETEPMKETEPIKKTEPINGTEQFEKKYIGPNDYLGYFEKCDVAVKEFENLVRHFSNSD